MRICSDMLTLKNANNISENKRLPFVSLHSEDIHVYSFKLQHKFTELFFFK